MSKSKEQELARKIKACLEFLKEEAGLIIHDNEVASHFEMKPTTLSYAVGWEKHLGRTKWENNRWNRQKILDAIVEWQSLTIEDRDGKFLIHQVGAKPYAVFTDPANSVKEPDSDSLPLARHFYTYHFRDSLKSNYPRIQKAKLVISQYAAGPDRVELTFFDQMDREARVVYEGRRVDAMHSQEAYFWLEKKGRKTDPPAFSSLILNASSDGYSNRIIFGTFNAPGPSCGKVILEKGSEKEVDESIAGSGDALITSLLAYHRSDAFDRPFQNWGEVNGHLYQDKIKSLAGAYTGYSLNHKRRAVSRHKLLIEPDGSALFYSPYSSSEYKGFVKLAKDLTIAQVCFDFRSDLHDYMIKFLLKLDSNPYNALFGVFYGLERINNDPMAGKCLFHRSEIPYSKITTDFFRDYDYLKKVEGLVDFFMGQDPAHRYCDSQELAMDIFGESLSVPAEREWETIPGETSRIGDLAGVYRMKRLSTNEKIIISNLLEIKPDGSFEMKGHGDPLETIFGRASIFKDSILCLSFEQKGDREFRGEFFFNVGSMRRNQFKYLNGASILITTKDTVRAGREVLFVADESFKTGMSYEVPIPYDGKSRKDFDLLNKRYYGVGRFLIGDTYNLIKPPRDPDKELKMKEDYKDIYFSAACYYGNKYAVEITEKGRCLEQFKAFLQRAIQHGFGLDVQDWEALERERIPGGLLSAIPEKEWKKINLKKLKF